MSDGYCSHQAPIQSLWVRIIRKFALRMDIHRILQTLTVAQGVGATVEDRRAEVALFEDVR